MSYNPSFSVFSLNNFFNLISKAINSNIIININIYKLKLFLDLKFYTGWWLISSRLVHLGGARFVGGECSIGRLAGGRKTRKTKVNTI